MRKYDDVLESFVKSLDALLNNLVDKIEKDKKNNSEKTYCAHCSDSLHYDLQQLFCLLQF